MKKKSGSGEGKNRLLQYIMDNEDMLFSRDLAFSLEMFGNGHLVLYGCRKILKYSSSEMIFSAKDFDVSVAGEQLNCAVYHIQGVEISGDIRKIEFI